jgi:hypothetical protein
LAPAQGRGVNHLSRFQELNAALAEFFGISLMGTGASLPDCARA